MFTTVRANELDLCQWELDSIYIRCVIHGTGRSCQGPSHNSWYSPSDLKQNKDCLIWISHVVSCQIVKKLRSKIIL